MNEKKVVVFKIVGEEFASDIMQVERILGYIEPTNVPEAPAYIEGVIKYQDTILPVMNLKKKFNLRDLGICDDSKIIVVRHEGKSIGVIVDTVSEVMDVKDEVIEETPDIVRGISNKYISGMIKLDSRIIILVDTASILSKDDVKKLQDLNM